MTADSVTVESGQFSVLLTPGKLSWIELLKHGATVPRHTLTNKYVILRDQRSLAPTDTDFTIFESTNSTYIFDGV
jgi:hypothetical protein